MKPALLHCPKCLSPDDIYPIFDDRIIVPENDTKIIIAWKCGCGHKFSDSDILKVELGKEPERRLF